MAALNEESFPRSLLESDGKYNLKDLRKLSTNYKLPYDYLRRYFVITDNETKEGVFML